MTASRSGSGSSTVAPGATSVSKEQVTRHGRVLAAVFRPGVGALRVADDDIEAVRRPHLHAEAVGGLVAVLVTENGTVRLVPGATSVMSCGAHTLRAEIDALFTGERGLVEVLEDVARLGVRMTIQTAVEPEVEAFLGRARYQRVAAAGDGEDVPVIRAGHRNGYHPTTIKSTAGPITVQRPKLRGTTEKFASRLFGTGITRTNALESLVIASFVRGLSVRDVENALADALGPEAALLSSKGSRDAFQCVSSHAGVVSNESPAYRKITAPVARQSHCGWIIGSSALVSLAMGIIAVRQHNIGQESAVSTDGVTPGTLVAEPTGAQQLEKQPPSKLDLLERSFDEVLDAIKHMDDKIGRLLTSVAFLTAATLALAALGAAKYLGYGFTVTPFIIPVALISITSFLLGVFIAVMLLLAGLTAPIGVPGVTGDPSQDPPDTGETDSNRDAEAAASRDARRTSQLWFLKIAEATQEEWKEEWGREIDRIRNREDDLIQETQNLARRATFKHDRIREAVAILSISLLAFAVAVVFTAAAASSCPAAASSCGPTAVVRIDALHRYALGALFAAYILVQVGIPVRHATQSITPAATPRARTERIKLGWKARYALSAALLVGALLAHPGLPDVIWLGLVSICAISSMLAFPFSLSREGRVWKTFGVVLLTGAVTVPAAYWGIDGSYAWQLASAVGVSGALLISSLLRPTLDLMERQKRAGTAAGQTA
ncbi:MAG: hypothetical protein JWN15_2830 [Firmicutes bacterium]|nr:hypothetical protein [Bacillota bacterium]